MAPSPLIAFKLPFAFDAGRLQADLRRVAADDWVGHFNRGYYDGDWSGVALRSVDGRARSIAPGPAGPATHVDTSALAGFDYIPEVLDRFECPLRAARLLRLGPGAKIREHTDGDVGYADGQVRFHIPIVTSAAVDFRLGGQRWVMAQGECWYLDFNRPHSVENRGEIERVHLVIDGEVNDWVTGVFERAAAELGFDPPSRAPPMFVEAAEARDGPPARFEPPPAPPPGLLYWVGPTDSMPPGHVPMPPLKRAGQAS